MVEFFLTKMSLPNLRLEESLELFVGRGQCDCDYGFSWTAKRKGIQVCAVISHSLI